MPRPDLSIVGGTDQAQGAVVRGNQGSTGGLVGTGVLDSDGNQYWKNTGPPPSGGGGGGDVTPVWKLDVPRDVQWMKVLWAFLIPGLAWFVFYFVDEMKDVRHDISTLNSNIAGQSSTINGMSQALGRIENRLDGRNVDQSQAGQGPGQAGAVRGGAGSGGQPEGQR